MIFRSITVKLLFIFIGTLIITLFSILLIADRQLDRILDRSQTEVYSERLELIWIELNQARLRLENTGMVDVYREFFREGVLTQLEETYYDGGELSTYPFIVDGDLRAVLHPYISEGEEVPVHPRWREMMESPDQGEFTTDFMGADRWYIYRRFEAWDWQIYYTLPLSEKYRDARSFSSMLLIVMLMFTAVILPVLIILLINFIKPVIMLTEASRRMAEGELDQHILISSRDEIGVLAGSFEEMQSSIKQKIEDLHHEINERKRVEKELQGARNYIFSVVESMPSVLIGVDADGVVSQWNSRAEELTDIPSSGAVGRALEEVFPIPEIDMFSIQSSIRRGVAQYYPQQVMSKEDTVNYIDITIYPLKSHDRQGAVIRIDDVTDKTLLEEQLVQAQKMDAIGHLAGGIAHDFNNMLAGITGAASLLQITVDPADKKSGKYLDLILDASSKAADLTSKLLAFGRKESLSSAPVDIHELIRGTLALLERTLDRKIEIVRDIRADHPVFTGDYSAIQNALMNLAINASHAMGGSGVLTVRTANLTLDEYFCRISPFDLKPGEYIAVEVEDTGVGIAPESLGKIFEPFYTTKDHGSGTGLGLSSVYGTMQNHKGAVMVESDPGQGAVFRLYLPCSEQSRVSLPAGKSSLRKGSGTILLIDDEEVIRQTAEPLLSRMGYRVLLAADGLEGLEIFKRESRDISIVISDMIMPRMSGKELFYKIRELDPACPFIISSGFTRDENLSAMRQDGLAGFIQKPFLAEDIAALLDDILH